MTVWTYLLGPLLSLLPEPWRKAHLWRLGINWARASLISGFLEVVIFGRIAWTSPSRLTTGIAAYLCVEGVVRFYAALSPGEALGTFPLIALADLTRIARNARSRPQIPLVRDEITAGDATCDLKIGSCRARQDWKYPFTLRYAGAYFQVVGYIDLGAGPRPYVYSLRRLPPGEIAGGLKDYTPDDILTAIQPLQRIES
ncbi:MAG TPA: hypothetical protein VMH00_17085 [Candidatus Limnocylindrales bacterium]|nr:hypothetical protein [Candidatus Limnocylindrales bacterium]